MGLLGQELGAPSSLPGAGVGAEGGGGLSSVTARGLSAPPTLSAFIKIIFGFLLLRA